MYILRNNIVLLLVGMISYAVSDTSTNGAAFNPLPTTGPAWVGVGTYLLVSFAVYWTRKADGDDGNV